MDIKETQGPKKHIKETTPLLAAEHSALEGDMKHALKWMAQAPSEKIIDRLKSALQAWR